MTFSAQQHCSSITTLCCLFLLSCPSTILGFTTHSHSHSHLPSTIASWNPNTRIQHQYRQQTLSDISLHLSEKITDDSQDMTTTPKIKAVSTEQPELQLNKKSEEELESLTATTTTAQTNTVNQRLLAELEAATKAEKSPKTNAGKKLASAFTYSTEQLTPEQQEAKLAAARDLNGVNPIVTILGSFFAFGMAFALWSATSFLSDLFTSHPVSPDAPYAFARGASVVRNAVMGLSSLAAGFFGVTGLGIFALGVRVAYGVYVTGELDPTPIVRGVTGRGGSSGREDIEMPNVWDLMMNKKPNRRGGGKKDDNNPFGL